MNAAELLISNVTGFDASRLTPTVKTVAGTNPAANVECSDTVPAGKVWKLLAYTVTLVQGATQTPTPNLTISDGTTVVSSYPGASAAVSVSTTTQLVWAPLQPLTAGAGATFNTAPIPGGLILPAGYKLITSTAGKGANTDYGAPAIWVVEYA
jgi:hypothetical protein